MAPLDQFILFGDSITQMSSSFISFAPALQNAYARKLDVINRGFSGYNTDHALVALPQFMPTPEQATVRFLLIFFGANDCNRGKTTKQHVPLERFQENLTKIITDPLVRAHKPRIILITTPPVDEATCREVNGQWGNPDEPRRVRDTLDYRRMVQTVGEQMDCAVVDLWGAIMEACGWKDGDDISKLPGQEEFGKDKKLLRILDDGLHFTGEGYRILYEELMKCIREKFPDQAPENLVNVIKMQWEIDLGW